MTDPQLVPVPMPVPLVLTDTHQPDPSRRGVLRAVAYSGAAAALLAACGGGGDDSAASTPSATSSEDGDESSSAGSGGGALVATADVPVGGGIILEAEKIVVTQQTEGTFKAFTAVCTHQACTVASVKKDRISCACHGSAYSTADGSVLNGPATKPLKEIPVTVEGDQVVQT